MELEDLVEKYRGSKSQIRFGLIAIVGILPGIYLWVNEGEALEARKANVEAEYQTELTKYEDAKQKAAELPALLAKLSEIEGELQKAKEILPDQIEMDSVLGTLGNLEKEVGVKLVKFTPGQEVIGSDGLYFEVPVEITMQGAFSDVMRFVDRLVHLPNLTHVRNLKFAALDRSEEEKKAGPNESAKLETTARLILFKGI